MNFSFSLNSHNPGQLLLFRHIRRMQDYHLTKMVIFRMVKAELSIIWKDMYRGGLTTFQSANNKDLKKMLYLV